MCDEPEAFREKHRKARQDHRCCECHGTIEAGSQYLYSSGVWDGGGRSYKTCLNCAKVRADTYKIVKGVDACGAVFGGLAQWLLNFAIDSLGQPMRGGFHGDVIARGGEIIRAELAKMKSKPTEPDPALLDDDCFDYPEDGDDVA